MAHPRSTTATARAASAAAPRRSRRSTPTLRAIATLLLAISAVLLASTPIHSTTAAPNDISSAIASFAAAHPDAAAAAENAVAKATTALASTPGAKPQAYLFGFTDACTTRAADAVTALGPKLAKFNVTIEWGYDIHGVRGVKVAYTGPALPPVSVLQAAVPCLSYVEKDGTLAHAGVVPSGSSSATVAPPVSNDGSNSGGMDGGNAAAAGDAPAATATGAANGKATGKSGGAAAPSASATPVLSPVTPVSNATAVTAPAPPGQENACIKSEAMTVSQSLWGIDAMDGTLDGKYEYDLTGAKVHVYVLDSGVRFDHPEFEGARADIPFTAKTLADDRQAAQLTDCTGHGTHVSAVIAGHTVGVAKQATVHALRIIGCDKTGSVSDAIEALNWVAANLQTPAVINLSLGSTDSLSGFTLPNAISALVNKGVHVVIAAGNSAVDACSSITPSTPSLLNIPNTYVVGALGHPAATDLAQGKYLPKIASFSNTGSCVKYWAPGVDIWSASNRSIAVDADVTAFESRQGTSQAAPMVAGAIALHLQATPTLTPADLTKSLSANGLALPWGGVHVLGPAPSSSSSKPPGTASALAFPLATCTTNNTGVAAALRQAFHSRRAPYYAIAAGTACTVIAVGGVAWWVVRRRRRQRAEAEANKDDVAAARPLAPERQQAGPPPLVSQVQG